MVEQMAPGIYRIEVTLPNNPLKATNSYFIEGNDRDLLIDTGFRCEESRQALAEGLEEIGSRKERRDIFLTHAHSDHSGLASEFAAEDGKIYMSRTEMSRLSDFLTKPRSYVHYEKNGFPADAIAHINETNVAIRYSCESMDGRFTPLEHGEEICVGDFSLCVVPAGGHTPDNVMLWAKKQKIMFTGDHVLFDISPNITAWVGVEDSLGCYLDSLNAALAYDVELALPGHRKPGNYAERIRALLAHHEYRLSNALDIIRENPGLCAFEIAGLMQWRIRARSWAEFPMAQKWFAVGECMSHLDHLFLTGEVERGEEAGVLRYRVN